MSKQVIKHYEVNTEDLENGTVDFSELVPTFEEELEEELNYGTILAKSAEIGAHNAQQRKLAQMMNLNTIKDYKILTTN